MNHLLGDDLIIPENMSNQDNFEINMLSNSGIIVHFEINIIITELGKLFNEKVHEYTGLDVFVSYMDITKETIIVYIKVCGQQGGHFGVIATYNEENIFDLKNAFCKDIMKAYTESKAELIQRSGYYKDKFKETVPYKLHIEVIDFKKRSRIGFIFEYITEIQRNLRNKFPEVSFIVRFKDDDTNFYYLIFDNKDELKKAQEIYGIDKMIEFVGEMCRKQDEYGVFDNYLPIPDVTDKITLKEQGAVMGIMRNNPDFTTW